MTRRRPGLMWRRMSWGRWWRNPFSCVGTGALARPGRAKLGLSILLLQPATWFLHSAGGGRRATQPCFEEPFYSRQNLHRTLRFVDRFAQARAARDAVR